MDVSIGETGLSFHRCRLRAPRGLGSRPLPGAWALGVAALALALVGSAGVAAAAGEGFSPGVRVSSPPNADANSGGWLLGVSCTSPGACTAVGDYDDTSGHQQAMAVTETGGKWARGSEVSAPANSSGNPDASLGSVSCKSAGDCTAVGTYTSASDTQEAMVVTETDGKWGRAAALSSPAGASATRPTSDLRGVSCASSGNCIAVGSYVDSSGGSSAMIATEAGGKWGPPAELILPANAGTGTSSTAALFQVSCVSSGICTAVGLYSDTSHDRLAMVADETGGKWGPAVAFDSLPSGANGTWASLFGVWCTSAGNCAADGSYVGSSGSEEAMVATESGGKWGSATELSLPKGANSQYPNAEMESVSCTSPGNCAGFGAYSTTASYSRDMVATETNGKWSPATELATPAGGKGTPTILGGSGNGVGCTTKGICTAVGSYGTGSGGSTAMAASGTV
jgi:hypothetical protein